jgi:adenylate cyclase class 1
MDHNQIINRFLHLNRTRIERLSKLVTLQQQPFFKLLPFLIHTNIPDLPGYVSKDTPVGIIDYQVDDKTINDAEQLSPGFRYKRHGIRHYAVSGLYLINPYGLLNIPEQPAFTLYLVHTDINDEQRQALEKKLILLTRWAKELNIGLTTIFLAQKDLNQTSFSPEQREQFYLNGLNLGGAVPLWWLVSPTENYQAIAASVSQQRLQTSRMIFDFGQLEPASPQTLIDNATDLLDKGIEQGLTHLLSLLYSQHQIDNYPAILSLSDEVKKAVYEGESEPLAIDYKVLQLKQFNTTQAEPSLKKLAQQSLYIQAQEALSKKTSQPKYPWRRDFIRQLPESWSWPQHEYPILDQRDNAKYQHCLDEHRQTQAAFSNISSTIRQFSKQHQLILKPQHKLIDKKLQNYNDTNPRIIGKLPNGLLAKSPEDEIHLYRFEVDDGWKLSLMPLSTTDQRPLYQNSSLLHVLTWAIYNGLLVKATRILIADKTHLMTIKTVVSLVQQLLRSPLAKQLEPNDKVLSKPAKLNHLMLFANLELMSNNASSQQSLQLSSLYNDSFNYADRGDSLLYSIDGLICSSWGEWQTFHYQGQISPLNMFESLIPWWIAGKTKTLPTCWCPSEAHGPLISNRLQSLYEQVNAHYQKNKAGDYIVQIADGLHQLRWQPTGFDITALPKSDLVSILTHLKSEFSVTKVDIKLDPLGFYQQLLLCQNKDTLSLVIQPKKQAISLHIIDENGNLFSQHDARLSQTTTINHYIRFLTAIKKQPIRCFEIEQQANYQWQIQPIKQPPTSEKQGYLPVTVKMDSPKENALCTIQCGPEKFSGYANDAALFEQVSTFIISLRKNNKAYPLYINEISFSNSKNVSTSNYLFQKQRIEKLFNHD